MPIEINQLEVVAVVSNESGSQGSGELSADKKEEIIAACVEQVLQVLQDQKER